MAELRTFVLDVQTSAFLGHDSKGTVVALAIPWYSDYSTHAPEKEGAGFSSLNTQSAQTAPSGFFMCVCLRAFPWSGGGGEAFGLAGFFGYQSANPAICRSTRLAAGCGATLPKEAYMPSMLNAAIPHVPFIRRAQSLRELSEPLYDVLNERGELLVRCIAHTEAVAAIEANQSVLPISQGWEGRYVHSFETWPARGYAGRCRMSAAYVPVGALVPCAGSFVRAIDFASVTLSDVLGVAVSGSLADAISSIVEQMVGAA